MKSLMHLIAIWEILASLFNFITTTGHSIRDALLLFLGYLPLLLVSLPPYPLNKSSLFIGPTQDADCIDNLIHLLQRLPVHTPVQFAQTSLDWLIL